MGNLKIFISLIVSDIGNSVYLLKILIKHSFHCVQFNRLANFGMIKLGILERKVEDATHLFQLFVKEKAAESTYS